MGSIYRRRQWHCTTCGKRLDRTADRRQCEAAGHDIEQRDSPIWWIKYRRAGKSYAESSETNLKSEAKLLLQQREGDISRGKHVTPKMARLSFDDAAKDLLADYTTNKKKSYGVVKRRVEKHLTPFFGGRRMADISSTLVRGYIAHRQSQLMLVQKARPAIVRNSRRKRQPDGAMKLIAPIVTPARDEIRRTPSNAEINRELALLKRMFSLAIDAETLVHRPKIAMLREDNIRTGFFEPDQLASVLAHLPNEIRPVIQFAHITGWRVASEILPLEWRRVDFASEVVYLDHGKTKNREGRKFPFTSELRDLLLAQRAEHDRMRKAGFIVPTVFFREIADERGGVKKPRPIKSFTTAWKHATRAAGCPDRIPHDLRRTAIRNLVRAGVSESVAMRLSGHKTASVFKRYDITSDNDLRDAARRLDDTAAMVSRGFGKEKADTGPTLGLTRPV